MLFYREDRLVRSEFGDVWARVEDFLQLAAPASRKPEAVTIWDERDPEHRTETTAFVTDDAPRQAEVDELYARARLVHQQAGYRVYLRWQPEFGPPSVEFPRLPVNHQLALLQQFRPHLWIFFQLLTAFERADDSDFRQFLEMAEQALRIRLPAKNWRRVSVADSGKPIFRRVEWPVPP